MTRFLRTASGVLVALVATGIGALAIAADVRTPTTATEQAEMAQRHKAMIQRHLDDAAARLEIKASQQSAWQGYATAVKDLAEAEGMPPRPDADADATTIARQRAERASAFARRLGVIADATAKLQGVLTPEQKSVLTELTRNAGMHGGPGAMMMMHRQMMDGRRGPMDRGNMGPGGMGPGAMDRGSMDRAPAAGAPPKAGD
ncbi:MAG: Spy/CpxP family protein refolding chaperone [Steroidobacteraceae bacterium]